MYTYFFIDLPASAASLDFFIVSMACVSRLKAIAFCISSSNLTSIGSFFEPMIPWWVRSRRGRGVNINDFLVTCDHVLHYYDFSNIFQTSLICFCLTFGSNGHESCLDQVQSILSHWNLRQVSKCKKKITVICEVMGWKSVNYT